MRGKVNSATRKCVMKGVKKMPCINLKGEMAKNNITIEEMAKFLNIHRNSVSNKLNGDSAFSIDEAFKIQKKYFPKLSMDYLFSTEQEGDE